MQKSITCPKLHNNCLINGLRQLIQSKLYHYIKKVNDDIFYVFISFHFISSCDFFLPIVIKKLNNGRQGSTYNDKNISLMVMILTNNATLYH